jgi:hypothetical protein
MFRRNQYKTGLGPGRHGDPTLGPPHPLHTRRGAGGPCASTEGSGQDGAPQGGDEE